jgi:hypothetical protein
MRKQRLLVFGSVTDITTREAKTKRVNKSFLKFAIAQCFNVKFVVFLFSDVDVLLCS